MLENETDIWKKYRRGVDHHTAEKLVYHSERCHNFYSGNQWWKAETGGKELPVLNFIKPVGKYKISMIAQNNMSIVYSDMAGNAENASIFELLNLLAAKTWEKSKMDTLSWEVIKNAYITGDHYAYWHDDRDQMPDSIVENLTPQLKCRLVNKSNIFLEDEQNPDLQEQQYIIISERVPVSKVRQQAGNNKIPARQIALITSDEEKSTFVGESTSTEVKTAQGKCTSLLYISRDKDKNIWFCRSTRNVIYQPKTIIKGLKLYPIVGMRWENFIGSARGISGVQQMIPSQVTVNKLAAWRSEGVQRYAFPKLVYDSKKILNPDALNRVGAEIELKDTNAGEINNIITYLNPAPMSGDTSQLQNELISLSRELEGAGDAATGAVDPTKASGEAIRAARDQAAVPLNEQIAAYKQFIEDTAALWLNLWTACSPYGVEVAADNGTVRITPELLQGLNVDIRIDVTPVDPYSRVAQDMLLKGLMEGDKITFDEYIETISDSTSMPKAKLQEILEKRNSAIDPQLLEVLRSRPDISQQLAPLVMQMAAQEGGEQNGAML